uniref:SUN domain-containing protein n=1 Tax=Aquila chrysaetos chrysaetos TaxID=223781 RepID=A0A663F1A6_AQUCH
MTVAERLPWAHPSAAVRPLAGAAGTPRQHFRPLPLHGAFLGSTKEWPGPPLLSRQRGLGLALLPFPWDLAVSQHPQTFPLCGWERNAVAGHGDPLLFLGHLRGCVPPVLLAAGQRSRPHHTLAFIALALCFQPDASPGYCWPFQGSRSEVLIRLPTQIRPTAVTIQHASKIASPPGTVSSAPRDFTVSVSLCRALGAGTWPRGKALTGTCCSLRICRDVCAPKHCCSPRGRVTLLFATVSLQNGDSRAFRFLKLVIESNWGKPGYTCIYRVQVYGKTVGTTAISQMPAESFPQ